ncbi:MAG: hypothetical protein WCD38_05700 [Candidatus Tumulicola sp.]
MSERFSLSLDIEDDGKGGLTVSIRPLDEAITLSVQRTTLLMTAWREADSLVRARVEHAGSGSTGYVQSNDSLFAIGRKIGLAAHHR